MTPRKWLSQWAAEGRAPETPLNDQAQQEICRKFNLLRAAGILSASMPIAIWIVVVQGIQGFDSPHAKRGQVLLGLTDEFTTSQKV